MKKIYARFSSLVIFFFFTSALSAVEQITQFKSDITIHTDGSMSVREDITVIVEGYQVRRGIVREFPTIYKDSMGNRYTVGFTVERVEMDGNPIAYVIESANNGKYLNFGDDHVLSHGKHTFTVEYRTNRQLGYFANHDELYWNVTGAGWRLPIVHAIATVHLPKDIPASSIRSEAYTGAYGSREKYVSLQKQPHGVTISTTRPLRRYEGLTIVVGWPKGYITQPSAQQEWQWFLQDNSAFIVLFFGWLVLLAYLIYTALRIRRERITDPIIPLFYPPNGMLPGGMRYFMRMRYDSIVLAADVVNMAVKGWLKIEYKKGLMWGGTYTLKKMEEKEEPLYRDLSHDLFVRGDSLSMSGSHNSSVQLAIQTGEAFYQKAYTQLFDFHTSALFGAFLIAFLSLLNVGIFANLDGGSAWLWWWALGFGAPIVLFYVWHKGYTAEGMKLRNEIEGFKLFLETTETDRLKVIGTPPTKTPELYETYLPYAMALGVEDQWSAQFAPLFEKLRQAGTPYVPIWVAGWDVGAFRASQFASGVSRGMSSAISSSASRPGSSSGFSSGGGGGGFSGGGGGGGGGGGR